MPSRFAPALAAAGCALILVASCAGATQEPRGLATARCRDGERSFSESRQGACSQHGGVLVWLVPADASAKCADGSYSTALTRQGACSSHGGVVTWMTPTDATARCGDGTYSMSRSRLGTCSSHGGVAEWLDSLSGVDTSTSGSPATDIEAFVVANMKSDLRDLVTAEEAYFADSVHYTSLLGRGGANFAYSEGNSAPRVTLTEDGWTAVTGNIYTRTKCVIFVGTTPLAPARKEGFPTCG